MIKLSDSQLVVLSAACQRADRNVLLLPANLKGGAQQKVVGSLLAKELVEQRAAGPEDAVWRTEPGGRKLALLATDAAFHALGIEVEAASGKEEPYAPAQAANGGGESDTPAGEPGDAGAASQANPKPRKVRTGTKQAQLIAMLQQPEGASLDEIVAATGWQAHTVRGAIAGALKKKLGLKVESRGTVYRIPALA